MAAVSLPDVDSDRSDRAQLVLVTGLALAISLVAIALVLNSAIYTHNLASRYDSPGDGVAMANGDLREGAGAQIRHVNDVYAGSSYGTIESNYQGDVSDVEAGLASDAAVNGRLYQVSAAGDTEGVRIVDAESGGSNFHPRYGATDEWTVASEVGVRSFRIRDADGLETLSTSEAADLLDSSLLSLVSTDAFVVVFDDGTTEHQVSIYQDSTIGAPTVMVHEVGTSVHETCSTGSTPVDLDLAAGTFDGEPCAPLSFADDLDGTVDVRYYYGDKIDGQYRMVVDVPVDGPGSEAGPFTDRVDALNHAYHCGDSGAPKATYYEATSSDFPRISPAIYATTVDVTYDSPDITYEGTQRVAPGEVGTEPVAPRVTQFDVTDSTSGDDTFTITWSVSDPNGDLSSVDVEIADSDDETPISVSGSTAGPTTVTRTDSDSGSDPYEITVTVEDAAGNSRSVTQTHADDGDESGCPA